MNIFMLCISCVVFFVFSSNSALAGVLLQVYAQLHCQSMLAVGSFALRDQRGGLLGSGLAHCCNRYYNSSGGSSWTGLYIMAGEFVCVGGAVQHTDRWVLPGTGLLHAHSVVSSASLLPQWWRLFMPSCLYS